MILARVLKCKIHRATITDANVEYEGSVTIDRDLMDAAQLADYEQIHVWNVTRGSRVVTYAMPGKRGSGTICMNGAGALLNASGDCVILAAFVDVDEKALEGYAPIVVFVDGANRVRTVEKRPAGK